MNEQEIKAMEEIAASAEYREMLQEDYEAWVEHLEKEFSEAKSSYFLNLLDKLPK